MQGDMISPPSTKGVHEVSARRDAIKRKVSVGDVAALIGMDGSTAAGWDCPLCESHLTLKERKDGSGARCTVCNTGVDIFALMIRAGDGMTFLQAITALEKAIKDGVLKDNKTGDLFDGK